MVARRLRPGVLDDLGLLSAMDSLAADFAAASSEAPIHPRWTHASARLEQGRRAGAVPDRPGGPDEHRPARRGVRAVDLTLDRTASGVVLRITDDGRGIDGSRRRRRDPRDAGAGHPGRRRSHLDRHRPAAPASLVVRRIASDEVMDTMPTPTRILLADDHGLVRRGLRLILDGEPDLTVVAEAADGAAGRRARGRAAISTWPSWTSRCRGLTGLQAARESARRAPDVRILMLSMYDNEQYFFEALKAGASGYVLKSVADRDLVEACRAVRRGEPFVYAGADQRADQGLPAREP